LSYPAIGNGPFPGVLLIHGSGPTDMNETPAGTYKPLWQISEYLSERGFAVLKYDKRGVGENGIIINQQVWENATVNDFIRDAEKALDVLLNQSQVDPKRISVVGHSEGTMIAPRVALDNPTKIENIVLMGTVAQNLIDLLEFQIIKGPLMYAIKILDKNNTGEIPIDSLAKDLFLSSHLLPSEITIQNNTEITTASLIKLFNDQTNGTDTINIQSQIRPVLVDAFNNQTDTIQAECKNKICPVWLGSHKNLLPTIDMIGNISTHINVLLLNGENDSQTPVQQAFLIKQKLDEFGHINHELITYPNLGHLFYNSSIWETGLGPIQPEVLQDLYVWLESHSK
jgi:uncharacterized protein